MLFFNIYGYPSFNMFGAYRFILATLVALSHFGFKAAGFNPGQWAVISFYTLSGLLMERQFQKLSRGGNGTGKFFLDRFLRIWPLFLVVVLFAWLNNRIAIHDLLITATLLPLNYSFYTGIPMLIATSWSLACEVHFYLLVPVLTLSSIKNLRVLVCLSLCLFAVSPFLKYSDFWAYGALPGILFTFLSGILINRRDYQFLKLIRLIMVGLLLVFGVTKHFHPALPSGININVIIGYLIATLAIPALEQYPSHLKWDKMLGLFSYPLFLCHMPVANFLVAHGQGLNTFDKLFVSLLFSAVLIVLVEMPFDHIRYRARNCFQNDLAGSSGRTA